VFGERSSVPENGPVSGKGSTAFGKEPLYLWVTEYPTGGGSIVIGKDPLYLTATEYPRGSTVFGTDPKWGYMVCKGVSLYLRGIQCL